MTGMQTWDISLIQVLQDTAAWLSPVMKMFTLAGNLEAYMAGVAIIYWSVDRKLGLRMAIFLPITASLNSILKQAIHAPRPFWIDNSIKALLPSDGFGMPSGHAQSATVWLLLAAYIKKRWFWILAITMTLGVGISRTYLGVHFSVQVIIGWLLGIAVILCFIRFEIPVISWLVNLRLSYQLIFLLACTALILLAGMFFVFRMETWNLPVAWIKNASPYLSIDKVGLQSLGLGSVAGNAGGFLGAAIGGILLNRKGNFNTGGTLWIHLLRIALGLFCIVILYSGLQLISPDRGMNILYIGWRFLGLFLISFSAVFLIPRLFVRLNLLKVKS